MSNEKKSPSQIMVRELAILFACVMFATMLAAAVYQKVAGRIDLENAAQAASQQSLLALLIVTPVSYLAICFLRGLD